MNINFFFVTRQGLTRLRDERFIVPEIASSACWQIRARSQQLHPTVCCEPDSAGSQYTGPGGDSARG